MLLRILKSKFIGFKLNLIFIIINNNVHIWGASLFFMPKKAFKKANKIIFLIKLFFIIKFSF